MIRRTAALLAASGVLLCAGTAPRNASGQEAQAYARIEGDQCIIGNHAIERIINTSGQVRTTAIKNKIADKTVPLNSAEFALGISSSDALTAADFALESRKANDLPQGQKQIILTLADEKNGVEVQIVYEVAVNEPVIRKRLSVRAIGDMRPVLTTMDVEQFTTEAACDLGGLGQPVFVADSLFMGLEYPAGRHEIRDNAKARPPSAGFSVTLRHFPGKTLTPTPVESNPAVVGAGPQGAVEQSFAAYLAGIRIPPRTHVHYNSWYDIRQDKMSAENFLATFEGFKKNLCDRYGVKMDSFVPDDGWQDRQSLWEINKKLFPNGFDELAAGLKAGGSSLGLWHPLTAVKGNLDMDWCAEHGYETNKTRSTLCLSAPKHNAQLREVMTRHVKKYGINYFKHDFNSFSCDVEGHGHLPKMEYGFEANVDAYIEMLKLFRHTNPDIFLNCTGGMWLSPWWLMHCHTVWRGASDTGYEKAYPFLDQRAQAMSYVDAVLHDNFVKNRYQFPISALMVHGIVYGQLHMLGGKEEPLESWTDNAVWSVCLGLMMKELYITPALLSDAHWDVLGKCLQWAEANKDVLVETRMIGGNPREGNVIGYKHAAGNRTIVFVRNPTPRPQKATFDLAPSAGDRTPRLVENVYPCRKFLAGCADPSRPFDMELAPYEMLVVEAMPAAEARRPVLQGCTYSLVSQSEKEIIYSVSGAESAVRISSPVRIKEILVDGTPQAVSGDYETNLSLAFPAAPQGLQVEETSPAPQSGSREQSFRVSVPEGVKDAKFFLVCEKFSGALPLGKITVNGQGVKTSALTGDRWRTFVIPLQPGANEVAWSVEITPRPRTPFAARSFALSCYAGARRSLPSRRVTVRLAEAAAAAPAGLPTPFAAQKAEIVQVCSPREINTTPVGGFAKIKAETLRTVKAAKLHFSIFGVNEEEQYRHKPVTLNGIEIGILPANPKHNLDSWSEKTMDIPEDKLGALTAHNVVTVAGCGGDCFKFTDIALAAQLPDGSWVESNHDANVYCGVGPGWMYFEGTPFAAKSPEIKLALPVE